MQQYFLIYIISWEFNCLLPSHCYICGGSSPFEKNLHPVYHKALLICTHNRNLSWLHIFPKEQKMRQPLAHNFPDFTFYLRTSLTTQEFTAV